MSVADDIGAALRERGRAPAVAEQRAGLNAFIRSGASWEAARGESDSDDGGLDPEIAADQDRDDAGRFSAPPVTDKGLDQDKGGTAAHKPETMSSRLRRLANREGTR